MRRPRLLVPGPLAEGAVVALDASQAHKLSSVLRLSPGDEALAFDGSSGEWRARIASLGRREGTLECMARTRAQDAPPDLRLLFAPIKKARTDFIVEKAAELGAASVRPVLTRYTNAERVRPDRLAQHMAEAVEQCGGLTVPDLLPALRLDAALAEEGPRLLVFCDERGEALPVREALGGMARGTPASVLIGPEGGFAPEEASAIRAREGAVAVSLGPRILRADTAAVAALALVQAAIGDG